jgi:carbon storage regulator
MLVLSRKINETIVIGGNIRITMTSIRGQQVRLAIEAPEEVPILREELLPSPRSVPAEFTPP